MNDSMFKKSAFAGIAARDSLQVLKNQDFLEKKVNLSEKLPQIYDISDLHAKKPENQAEFGVSQNREVLSSSFFTGKRPERPVIESPFVSIAKNHLLNKDSLIENNRLLSNTLKNSTGGLDFDYNEYIKKRPEGLEKTKELMRNLEKVQEKPKLVPLQNFSSQHLNDFMMPVVKAVQSTINNMKKIERKIEKKEEFKDQTIERILEKQNEILGFMMQKTEDRKDKKIRLKYKEIQQEFDKIELGLSPDYSKANFLTEELNYMLNKDSEIQSIF